MAFYVYIRQNDDNQFGEIKFRLVKFVFETFFFNKAHLREVLWLLQRLLRFTTGFTGFE